jgi:hypothetical protein
MNGFVHFLLYEEKPVYLNYIFVLACIAGVPIFSLTRDYIGWIPAAILGIFVADFVVGCPLILIEMWKEELV